MRKRHASHGSGAPAEGSGVSRATGRGVAAHARCCCERCLELLAPGPGPARQPGARRRHARPGRPRRGGARRASRRCSLIGLDRDPQALAPRRRAAGALRRSGPAGARRLRRAARGPGPAGTGHCGQRAVRPRRLLDAARRAPAAGFAYAQDAPLDMRMDPTTGDHRRRGGQHLPGRRPGPDPAACTARSGSPAGSRRRSCGSGPGRRCTSSARLAELVRDAIPAPARRTGGHPAKRTFQALRIEVNGELAALERGAAGGARRACLWAAGSLCCRTTRSRTGSSSRRSPPGRGPPAPVDLPVVLPGTGPTLRLLTRGAELADRGRGRGEPAGRVGAAARRRARRSRRARRHASRVPSTDGASRQEPLHQPTARGRRGTTEDTARRVGDAGDQNEGEAAMNGTTQPAPATGRDDRAGDARGRGAGDTAAGALRCLCGRRQRAADRIADEVDDAGVRRRAAELGATGARPPAPAAAAAGAAIGRRSTAPVTPPLPIALPRAPFLLLMVGAGRRRRARRAGPEHEDQRELVPAQRPARPAGRAGPAGAAAGAEPGRARGAGQPARRGDPARPGAGRHAGLHQPARRSGRRRAAARHRVRHARAGAAPRDRDEPPSAASAAARAGAVHTGPAPDRRSAAGVAAGHRPAEPDHRGPRLPPARPDGRRPGRAGPAGARRSRAPAEARLRAESTGRGQPAPDRERRTASQRAAAATVSDAAGPPAAPRRRRPRDRPASARTPRTRPARQRRPGTASRAARARTAAAGARTPRPRGRAGPRRVDPPRPPRRRWPTRRRRLRLGSP